MSRPKTISILAGCGVIAALATFAVVPAGAHDGPEHDAISQLRENLRMLDDDGNLVRRDPDVHKSVHDMATSDVLSDGPFADVVKNLTTSDRGERVVPDATTDVWALGRYAYVGTFDVPCGDGAGENGSGIRIFDVHNYNKIAEAGFIPSVEGSRSNDVKVAHMNSGAVLVHSNESCGGGRGGFEIWNVDDPTAPMHLASVQTDDVNGFLRDALGFVDFGVHNLFLFTQGTFDYVAAVVESEFGNFQIFDITDPTNPTLVGFWGAEELRMVELGLDSALVPDLGAPEFGIILDLDAWLFDGFGASRNRFLHDVTISANGQSAYLSNWDAGLVLLDISDVTDPQLVSVALDPVNGSIDGEVNSHAAWPSADGTIVVETEEDFSVFTGESPLTDFTFQEVSTNTIPGVGISTNAGTDFENNPVGNAVTVDATSVTVDAGPLAPAVYPAVEGSGNQPKIADTGPIMGPAVWIGRACLSDPIENSGAVTSGFVAVVRRGACFFSDKLATAASLGAAAIVVSNNVEDSVWSGVRVWDYSDPANPVLASTFNTVCSADPVDPGCDPRGTYSVHNVIVENNGGKTKAYISWYSDGVLILDVSDPYAPVETARYHREGSEFEASNGGIQDVWGIYKEHNQPWIYASDRNGGLYVLKEYGAGSAKKGKSR